MTSPKAHVENFADIIIKSGLQSNVNFQKVGEDKIKFEVFNLSNDKIISTIDTIRALLCDKSEISVKDPLTFNEREFLKPLDLSNCIFTQKIIFRKCTFKKNVWFKSSQFLNVVSFKDSIFEGKVRFHYSSFNTSCVFQNTVFKDLTDFYFTNFYETQQFHLTDFLSVTIFSNVKFHKQTQFLYNKVSSQSVISFESATFYQALDISRANFWCKLSFWNVEIKSILPEMWLYQTDDTKISSHGSLSDARKRLRETYRIIKNEFTKEGNSIEALKYYSYEMTIFEKEVENSKNLDDRILLWLNKNSNNFGTSWRCGIIFTLLIAILFYIIFLLSFAPDLHFDFSKSSIGFTLRHFFEFLNVAKWDLKPFDIENYSWGYIVLFFGRLFVAYGYYQTIQAFRKYGSK
jgi:hypothetical protein